MWLDNRPAYFQPPLLHLQSSTKRYSITAIIGYLINCCLMLVDYLLKILQGVSVYFCTSYYIAHCMAVKDIYNW